MSEQKRLRFAYADPPYYGRCKLYGHRHEAPYGCWDAPETHGALIEYLDTFDAWALSGSAESLHVILPLCGPESQVLSWVKLNALPTPERRMKSWEPVILKGGRPPTMQTRSALVAVPPVGYTFAGRSHEHIIGEKPDAFARWIFAIAGLTPEDAFHDVFPGSGVMGRAWSRFCQQTTLALTEDAS